MCMSLLYLLAGILFWPEQLYRQTLSASWQSTPLLKANTTSLTMVRRSKFSAPDTSIRISTQCTCAMCQAKNVDGFHRMS